MRRRLPVLFFPVLFAIVVFLFLRSGGMVPASDEKGTPPAGSSSEPAKTAGEPKSLPTVVTAPVEVAPMSRKLELTGSVVPATTARMASPGEGPVENCRVREGDMVRLGETLLRIGRNRAADAQFLAARESLKEQEEELKRVEQLVKSGAIPGAQMDTARAKFQNARAQFEKARESSEDYSVKAPWDGIVSRVLVKDGDYVAPRTPLVEIFDPRSLVVRFTVPEVNATEIRKDMQVNVQLDAYPGRAYQARVGRAFPELDTRMRTRMVEAVPVEKVDLIPGMFARIEVILAAVPDALVVPSGAVLVTQKGEQIVFSVVDGKAQRRKVETGIEERGRIQILKGVLAGERIIVAGHEKLKDGMDIQVDRGNGQ
ncbi:MAG: efflux RND transporter periplasmic adaptor subunit [Syntrophobacteraceae bacterium]|nr:efflux RND transporter periplasmic adaptor subunit [Syntrophobacteraceae bacterium]